MTFYLRGALVEYLPTGLTGLIAVPNVIVFQYNPETMTHTWTQSDPVAAEPGQTTTSPLAVQGNPGESFSFTLFLDAADTIADGTDGKASVALAKLSGVYPRLAALEMLLYPATATTEGLLGTVTAKIGSLFGADPGNEQAVPANSLNTVLFVWGPGRIVPVRVTGLTVTERLYDRLLNPTSAEAQITLRVLTDDELNHDDTDVLAPLGRAANAYSEGLRQALAVANSQTHAADSVVGMLPI